MTDGQHHRTSPRYLTNTPRKQHGLRITAGSTTEGWHIVRSGWLSTILTAAMGKAIGSDIYRHKFIHKLRNPCGTTSLT